MPNFSIRGVLNNIKTLIKKAIKLLAIAYHLYLFSIFLIERDRFWAKLMQRHSRHVNDLIVTPWRGKI